jgi:hypothetical protein
VVQAPPTGRTDDQFEERLRLGLIVDLDAGFAEVVRQQSGSSTRWRCA